jgi:hypothetical protein
MNLPNDIRLKIENSPDKEDFPSSASARRHESTTSSTGAMGKGSERGRA